jgi:hypothetical protein
VKPVEAVWIAEVGKKGEWAKTVEVAQNMSWPMKGEVAKTEEAVRIEENICLIDTLNAYNHHNQQRQGKSPAFLLKSLLSITEPSVTGGKTFLTKTRKF